MRAAKEINRLTVVLWLFPGRTSSYTIGDLWRFLTSWQLHAAMTPILAIMVSMNTPLLSEPLDLAVRGAFWLTGFSIYLVVCMASQVLIGLLIRNTPIKSFPVYLLCIPATLLAAKGGSSLTVTVNGLLGQDHIITPNYWAIYLLVLGIEFLLLLWIFPSFRDDQLGLDTASPDKTPATPTPHLATTSPVGTITIGDRTFLISALKTIRASGHYLDIKTAQGEICVRATLKSALAQTISSDGVQLNRSLWVATTYIDLQSTLLRKSCVVTKDGDILDVATTRQKEVRIWINHLIRTRTSNATSISEPMSEKKTPANDAISRKAS